MNRLRNLIIPVVVLGLCLVMAGCASIRPEMMGTRDKDELVVYCLNKQQDGLEELFYTVTEKRTDKQVEELLTVLETLPIAEGLASAIPENIMVRNKNINNEELTMDFNAVYLALDPVEEALMRAAVVQTLVQLPGVSQVVFTIDGYPLKNNSGNEVGPMGKDSFTQSSSAVYGKFEYMNLTMYFPSLSGDVLTETTRRVQYDINIPIEKFVLEQLMKGPGSQELMNVIPPEANLISVSVTEGVCYVNFDEGFLEPISGLTAEVQMAAIVNTLVSASKIGQIQFLINGDSDVLLHGTMDLSNPFSRDLDLVVPKE